MENTIVTTFRTQPQITTLITTLRTKIQAKTDMLRKLVNIIIGAIFASTLLPVAMDTLIAANTDLWDPASLAMWGLLKIFVVLGTILAMIYSVLEN